jgi:hypothetical protein
MEINLDLLDAEEPPTVENPICDRVAGNVAQFTTLCGFSLADFSVLRDKLGPILAMPRRGRGRSPGQGIRRE